MKKFALILAVVLMTGTVSAITQSELDYFKDRYNNQTSKVPSVVGDIVGGEKLNVYVNRSNDTEVIGADMQGLEISEIVKGGYENQTMNVYADEDTVQGILSSETPFEDVKNELNANNITYNSTTTGGKVKLTVFNSLRGLASLFGLSF